MILGNASTAGKTYNRNDNGTSIKLTESLGFKRYGFIEWFGLKGH